VAETPKSNFVDLRNISKAFEPHEPNGRRIPVIDDVSMQVDEGEFIIYLGPSGCGKTTLMRIVGGLEIASAGEVFLAGERVVGPDRKKGMVFQAYTSFPWLSVFANIRFGTRYRNDVNAA
jgi:NitT/TauT family transport system ATP-binding protein